MNMEELLEAVGMGDEWSGDDATLTCKHGHTIEYDGECPDGCVSPLMALGLI
jgi:hypothetical protein